MSSYFSKIYINIIVHLRHMFQVVSFTEFSPPKPRTYLSRHPYLPHVPPISFFSIWSPERSAVSSTYHTLFTTQSPPAPLSPRLSQTKMSPSASFSQTPSAYILPSISRTNFHTHTKQQTKLYFSTINLYISVQQTGRQKILDQAITRVGNFSVDNLSAFYTSSWNRTKISDTVH